MTRLPTESWDVKAYEGPLFPKYTIPTLCSAPNCSRFADHAHHIARRSFIGGDVWWVSYEDGPVVGNICGLCWRCHEAVTLNNAAIVWEDRNKQYTWTQHKVAMGKLHPHPPMHAEKWPDKHEHAHIEGPGSNSLCPECHRPLRQPKEPGQKSEDAKRRKTWSIAVPDDTDEDGALVLDTLVEECAKLFGREDGGKLRYFVVAQALALVVQNGHLLSD